MKLSMLKDLKNFTIYTGVSAITGSISFLLLPVLTSYLSPDDYGIISIYNASVMFYSACISLGMGHVLMVDLIKDRLVFTRKLKSFFVITLCITFIISFFILVYSIISNSFFSLPISLVLVLPLVALLVVYFEFSVSVMTYLNQVKLFAYFSIGKFSIETILTLLFIVILGMNWWGRIASAIVTLFIGLFFCMRYLISSFDLNYKLKVSKRQAIQLMSEGGKLFFMTVSFMIINLSDRFFIQHFNGSAETGIYGVASTVAGIMFLIIGALMKIIRPKLYRMLNNTHKKKLIFKVGIAFHLIIIAFALLLIYSIPIIFKYFINQNFIDAKQISYYLIIGLVFFGGYNYFISFIIYSKRNKLNLLIAVSCILINLLLNYYLIQMYGSIGAAYSTLITYFCMFLFSLLFIMPRQIRTIG